VEIDIGLEPTALSWEEQAKISSEAARLGYSRMWIAGGRDPLQICAVWWAETRESLPGGIGTATGVVPIALHTPVSLAASAASMTDLTGGRFILGIGTGSSYSPAYRRTYGIQERSSLSLMRAYLSAIQGFLAGTPVSVDGPGFHYDNARLAAPAAHKTPVFLGALGPEMMRLAGELADGVCLSWATSSQIAENRQLIQEGAARAGRHPDEVSIATYVRIAISDDRHATRRAFGRAMLNYALGWPGTTGPQVYRIRFERMGFGDEIARLVAMRERGAPEAEVIDAFPEHMLQQYGYYGPAGGADEALRRHASGADIAIVRVVPVTQELNSILAALQACKPESG